MYINIANIIRSTIESFSFTVPSRPTITSPKIEINNKVDFDKNIFLSTLNGLIKATRPNINPVLHIIDPTAFPKLIVVWLFIDAHNDTVSSGRVVAKLTIVAPNTNSDTWVFFPISTVQFINISAPLVININPIINRINVDITKSPPLLFNNYSFLSYIC